MGDFGLAVKNNYLKLFEIEIYLTSMICIQVCQAIEKSTKT